MMIKILLADDQYLMLEGIKAILKHEPGIEIVGTAQDGKSAIAQVKKLQPDLVLIDIEMPRMNGITATKYICKYLPQTRVIVLSSHKSQKYISQALQAGASGYLSKDSLFQDLKRAIYSLDRGYSYIETNLLTKSACKIQTANIFKYQSKITYLKKYRKSIYKPSLKQQKKQSLVFNTATHSSAPLGMTKANLAPIFDLLPTKKPLTRSRTNRASKVQNLTKFDRQKYLKRITWLLMAIASFILSVIIF